MRNRNPPKDRLEVLRRSTIGILIVAVVVVAYVVALLYVFPPRQPSVETSETSSIRTSASPIATTSAVTATLGQPVNITLRVPLVNQTFKLQNFTLSEPSIMGAAEFPSWLKNATIQTECFVSSGVRSCQDISAQQGELYSDFGTSVNYTWAGMNYLVKQGNTLQIVLTFAPTHAGACTVTYFVNGTPYKFPVVVD